jgi:cytochrome P450 family 135
MLPAGPKLSRERQTARMAMRPLAFMGELQDRFGGVFTVRMADEVPWVVVSDPDLVWETLKAPPDVLHAGEGKRVLEPLVGGSSVLLLDEARHAEQRRLLLPPFRGNRIDRYEEAMRAAAEQAIDEWPFETPTPAAPRMRAIALEVILRTVFGVQEGGRLGALREALWELRVPGNAREGREPALLNAVARVDELVFAEIAERQSAGGGNRDDVLSLLLQARHEDGTPMAPSEIRDELMSLLLAGHETTATTLAWALERLAHHPEAFVRAEEDSDGGPYIDAVIKETLRLRPALPVVARAVKVPFQLGEHLIPPNTTIIAAILLVHHRADLYPDPTSFRPERFLDGLPDPLAWLPFGGGSRRCIGAAFALHEMRAILSTVLSRATVRPVGPVESMRFRNITLTPARGARVILQPR